MSSEEAAGDRRRLLFLVTDEISSVLLRGQLGDLVEQGFDVTAATCLADPELPRPGAWDDGVTVEHVPFVRQPAPLRDLRALWATVRLIRRCRPDVVNASTPKAGLLGSLAARLCRVPVRVYVVRGFRFETAVGRRRSLLRWFERVAIGSATQVVFNSVSLRQVAERQGLIGAGQGEVIGAGSGNGIDLDRFAPVTLPTLDDARRQLGVPEAVPVVGFVGRFTADKGIADLVRAVARLRATHPDVHLLLVGQFEAGDPVPPDVRLAIEDGHHVTVVPWLEHTGVAYRAIDVLAFPSYREGLPNVPLEAQLCGVPVVGYAATGTVDAVSDGETGVLVPTGAEHELTAAIGELIDDPARRSALGASGPAWVAARFDQRRLWSQWADRYRLWSPEAGGDR